MAQVLAALTLACLAMVPHAAGASEASCAATGSTTRITPSVEDMEIMPKVSLLQMAVNNYASDSTGSKALMKQEPVMGAFVPECNTICFQGASIGSGGSYVQNWRASPLNNFCPHAPNVVGSTCADLGFPALAMEHDACWPELSVWTAPTTNISAALLAIRQQSIADISDYASSHSVSFDFAAGWVACAGAVDCSKTPVPADAIIWWGASRAYSSDECPGIMQSVAPTLAAALGPDIASLTDALGRVCWEGSYDYLSDILSRLNRLPVVANTLFANVTVHHTSCSARGYATRDRRDECFNDAVKMMRPETENDDIMSWVMGEPGIGLRNTLLDNDRRHGLPEFFTIGRYSCHVCDEGGATRDRGMLITNMGTDFDGRFATSEACEEYPLP